MERLRVGDGQAAERDSAGPAARVSVVVPYRPDGGQRDLNWAWLEGQWRKHYPDWEVVVGLYPEEEGSWIKARATQRGLAQASGDILIIADADVWLEPTHYLKDAVRMVQRGEVPWVVPHRPVRRLNRPATLRFKEGEREFDQRTDQARGTHRGIAGGGLFVITRKGWEAIDGFDPRFKGWGGEDSSMSRAADTLVGRHLRMDGTLWHLWHPPQKRTHRTQGSPASRRLVSAYIRAKGRPALMRSLIDKRYQ